jgi:hypothetical protein
MYDVESCHSKEHFDILSLFSFQNFQPTCQYFNGTNWIRLMKKHDLTTVEIPIDPSKDVTRRKVGLSMNSGSYYRLFLYSLLNHIQESVLVFWCFLRDRILFPFLKLFQKIYAAISWFYQFSGLERSWTRIEQDLPNTIFPPCRKSVTKYIYT